MYVVCTIFYWIKRFNNKKLGVVEKNKTELGFGSMDCSVENGAGD